MYTISAKIHIDNKVNDYLLICYIFCQFFIYQIFFKIKDCWLASTAKLSGRETNMQQAISATSLSFTSLSRHFLLSGAKRLTHDAKSKGRRGK
jgi:hypothetical protein